MATSGSIIIHSIVAKLEADADKSVGYFAEINFNGARKITESISGQKSLAWSTALTFPVTEKDLAAPEIQIVMAIYTDDGKGKKEFFADGSFKFSEVRSQVQSQKTLSVLDKKRKQRGTVTFEVAMQKDSKTGQSQKQPTPSSQGPVGTLIIQPKTAILKKIGDGTRKIEPSVIIVLGKQALRTNPSEVAGYHPIWKDVLNFELKGTEEHIIFRVVDSSVKDGDDTLGEALLPFQDLAEAVLEDPTEFTIELEIKGVETGKLTLEAEYTPEIIPNPLKIYPSIEIPKGEYVCKKIKYSNPDNLKKTITILQADNTNLVQPRTNHISIGPKSFSEIRFKIYAPTKTSEQRVRLDIFVAETEKVEETLFFDLVTA